MRGEWCFWMNYLSPEKCDEIIRLALRLPATDPTIGFGSNFDSNPNYRRSKIRWLEPTDPAFKFVFDEFWNVLLKVNKDWFNFNVTHLPALQFTEYDALYLDEYKSHQDVFWINPSPYHRKISVVFQLTDPSEYEGGDLILENVSESPGQNDIRARGTAIVFPSFIYHKLTPVTKGKRYSLVGWFEGPKFQ